MKASARLKISCEEIRAIYAEGEEAVIVLVEGLVEQINRLETRVEALENQLSKNSRNSSRPPAGDGFRKRTKSLRQKSERLSGGQEGHPGSHLEWSSDPDVIVVHPVAACQGCGLSLAGVAVADWEARQIHDVPVPSMGVTEHQCAVKCCPNCGVLNRGEFPVGVADSVQYGANLQGLMVYLMELQLIPSARVCEMLVEIFGISVSEGTLYNVRSRCFEALETVEQEIKTALTQAAVIHLDETGFRVQNKQWWLHVACTDGLTFYFVHPKRGQIAMDAMNILPQFAGIGVHDGLKSYAQYEIEHSLCNAHHLRELIFIAERYEQDWATEMITLLVEMNRQVKAAKAEAKTALSPTDLARFTQQYTDILQRGFQANPPEPMVENQVKSRGRPKQSPAKNLLDRLKSHQDAVLRFIHIFAVPFDNNQAERDLRMMKLKQKISGCFRAEAGAQMFCRIRGYISTLRKQGSHVLDALIHLFMGDPVSPGPLAE